MKRNLTRAEKVGTNEGLTASDLTLEVENLARRLVVSYRALARFRIAAIQEGQVQALIDAALQLTEGVEYLTSAWTRSRDKVVQFQFIAGLSEPSRKILEALAELGNRSTPKADPTRRAGARLAGDPQERRR